MSFVCTWLRSVLPWILDPLLILASSVISVSLRDFLIDSKPGLFISHWSRTFKLIEIVLICFTIFAHWRFYPFRLLSYKPAHYSKASRRFKVSRRSEQASLLGIGILELCSLCRTLSTNSLFPVFLNPTGCWDNES